MTKKELLNTLLTDSKSIFENIRWNMGGVVGIISLIKKPQMFNLSNIPLRIKIEELDIDLFQCLGISLLQKDRQPRIQELLASTKRSLICESLEITADNLVRTSKIISTGIDPYNHEDYFNADIRDLWNTTKGRAGALISKEQRLFIEKCIAPLRNYIRHNNGVVPPNKSITYNGKPANTQFAINYEWKKNEDNNIKMPLNTAYYLFESIKIICLSGIEKAMNQLDNDV